MGKAVNLKQEQIHPKLPKQHYRKTTTALYKGKITRDTVLPYLSSKNSSPKAHIPLLGQDQALLDNAYPIFGLQWGTKQHTLYSTAGKGVSAMGWQMKLESVMRINCWNILTKDVAEFALQYGFQIIRGLSCPKYIYI